MNNPFHDHLDECDQCRNHPCDLCPDGLKIIKSMMTEAYDKFDDNIVNLLKDD